MSTKLILGAVAAVMSPAIAYAQTGPTNNIDDRLRSQLQPTTEVAQAEAMSTGDTDIFLLRKTPLFTVHGSFTASPTTNAFLAPKDEKGDTLLQLDTGLRIGTRIAGKVEVFAEVGVIAARYAQNPSLDYSAATGRVGIAAQLKPFEIALTYQPAIVYSADFGTHQLTQHRFNASVSLPFAVKGFSVQPSVSVERALSTPSDYRNWAYAANVQISHVLSRKYAVIAYVSSGYERREYDSYFFDFLGVKRNDDLIRASAGIVWRPRQWADVRLSYNFAHNVSTSDVNGYVAHSGSLGLSAQFRF